MTPGDVVVCISVQTPCCGITMTGGGVYPAPVLRRTHRVSRVGTASCMHCGCPNPAIQTLAHPHPIFCWPADCFRRIEPASVDIFRLATTRVPPTMEPVS